MRHEHPKSKIHAPQDAGKATESFAKGGVVVNAEMLLDAIGEIDERYWEVHKQTAVVPWRRRAVALIAAVLLLALCVGTAMAVSPKFAQWVLSIIHLETHETPPTSDGQGDPEGSTPGLHKIDTADIDGQVTAHYFTSDGVVLTCDGGFYTCPYRQNNEVPVDTAFWEIRKDGIVNVGAKRVEFPLEHGGRTFQIIFDYAFVNGRLAISTWQQGLNEDPVGNGWQLGRIGDRTDVLLLGIPALRQDDYSFDYFLLELDTLEYSPLLDKLERKDMTTDYCTVSADLRYAILAGTNLQTDGFQYWVADLTNHTLTSCDQLTGKHITQAYFLDEATAIFCEKEGNLLNILSYSFPTGRMETVLGDIREGADSRREDWLFGRRYLASFYEDGTVELVDIPTGDRLELSGLNPQHLTFQESPDGSAVFVGYRQEVGEYAYCFSSMGVLCVESGVLRMLTRDSQTKGENFWGWLDNQTVVLSARDSANAYYVYVYEFRE